MQQIKPWELDIITRSYQMAATLECKREDVAGSDFVAFWKLPHTVRYQIATERDEELEIIRVYTREASGKSEYLILGLNNSGSWRLVDNYVDGQWTYDFKVDQIMIDLAKKRLVPWQFPEWLRKPAQLSLWGGIIGALILAAAYFCAGITWSGYAVSDMLYVFGGGLIAIVASMFGIAYFGSRYTHRREQATVQTALRNLGLTTT